MHIAFIIYNGMTLLDFSGIYDPVTRLKSMGFLEDLTFDVCAFSDTVISFEGLVIKPDKVRNDLKEYDLVAIPGGNSIGELIRDSAFLAWIRDVSQEAVMAAVCGGSLLLGAAGFLKNKKATTHPGLMEFLKRFTDHVSSGRVVEDGNMITARGVTAAIDLGLYLCEKIAGPDIRKKIQIQMDYRTDAC